MRASPDSSWTFRSATAADLAAIVHLAVAFRDHLAQAAPSPDEFRDGFTRLLDDQAAAITVAARASADAAGYVLCRYRWSVWSGGEDVEIEDVFVAAAARRQGLGRRLVESALARAQARGCRVAALTTNERNTAALALYAQLGFSATRPRWQGGRQLWLERRLGPA